MNPKSIDIVDLNPEYIVKAKEKFKNINSHCSELTQFVQTNPDLNFDLVFGIWSLCYMTKSGIDLLSNSKSPMAKDVIQYIGRATS